MRDPRRRSQAARGENDAMHTMTLPTAGLPPSFSGLFAFDAERPQVPTPPNKALAAKRLRFIEEEFKEVQVELRSLMLQAELGRPLEDRLATLGRLLKELCDLRYVVEGTAVACGIDMDEAYEVVHESNMSKLWPDGTIHRDAGGKILKPPTYESPDMGGFIHVMQVSGDPRCPVDEHGDCSIGCETECYYSYNDGRNVG